MFARLFNNISPRNLLNALVLILALASTYWFYPVHKGSWFPVADWEWPLMSPWFTFMVFIIVTIGASLFYAESLNRKHLFSGQYLGFLLAAMQFWIWLYPLNAGPELWSILLFSLLIFQMMPVLVPKANAAPLNFGAGFWIAIAGFIHGESIFLLLIPLGLSVALRRLNGRSMLALLLGYGAVLYFAFSLDYFLDWHLLQAWTSEMQSLEFFRFQLDYQRLIPLAIMALFLGFSVLVNLAQANQYNNEQRQQVNFWLYYALVGVAGFLLFANSNFWLCLIIFPSASLGALAVQTIENRWLRDGILLLPFLAYLSFFFLPS